LYDSIIYSTPPGLYNDPRCPWAPVLVQLICSGKIPMNNYQLPEYTLQNTYIIKALQLDSLCRNYCPFLVRIFHQKVCACNSSYILNGYSSKLNPKPEDTVG
jgi:hypothetical protein